MASGAPNDGDNAGAMQESGGDEIIVPPANLATEATLVACPTGLVIGMNTMAPTCAPMAFGMCIVFVMVHLIHKAIAQDDVYLQLSATQKEVYEANKTDFTDFFDEVDTDEICKELFKDYDPSKAVSVATIHTDNTESDTDLESGFFKKVFMPFLRLAFNEDFKGFHKKDQFIAARYNDGAPNEPKVRENRGLLNEFLRWLPTSMLTDAMKANCKGRPANCRSSSVSQEQCSSFKTNRYGFVKQEEGTKIDGAVNFEVLINPNGTFSYAIINNMKIEDEEKFNKFCKLVIKAKKLFLMLFPVKEERTVFNESISLVKKGRANYNLFDNPNLDLGINSTTATSSGTQAELNFNMNKIATLQHTETQAQNRKHNTDYSLMESLTDENIRTAFELREYYSPRLTDLINETKNKLKKYQEIVHKNPMKHGLPKTNEVLLMEIEEKEADEEERADEEEGAEAAEATERITMVHKPTTYTSHDSITKASFAKNCGFALDTNPEQHKFDNIGHVRIMQSETKDMLTHYKSLCSDLKKKTDKTLALPCPYFEILFSWYIASRFKTLGENENLTAYGSQFETADRNCLLRLFLEWAYQLEDKKWRLTAEKFNAELKTARKNLQTMKKTKVQTEVTSRPRKRKVVPIEEEEADEETEGEDEWGAQGYVEYNASAEEQESENDDPPPVPQPALCVGKSLVTGDVQEAEEEEPEPSPERPSPERSAAKPSPEPEPSPEPSPKRPARALPSLDGPSPKRPALHPKVLIGTFNTAAAPEAAAGPEATTTPEAVAPDATPPSAAFAAPTSAGPTVASASETVGGFTPQFMAQEVDLSMDLDTPNGASSKAAAVPSKAAAPETTMISDQSDQSAMQKDVSTETDEISDFLGEIVSPPQSEQPKLTEAEEKEKKKQEDKKKKEDMRKVFNEKMIHMIEVENTVSLPDHIYQIRDKDFKIVGDRNFTTLKHNMDVRGMHTFTLKHSGQSTKNMTLTTQLHMVIKSNGELIQFISSQLSPFPDTMKDKDFCEVILTSKPSWSGDMLVTSQNKEIQLTQEALDKIIEKKKMLKLAAETEVTTTRRPKRTKA